MRYHQSTEYRNADKKRMKEFIGLTSMSCEGRSFVIDERDARMIVANLRLKEYKQFKSIFQNKSFSSFRLLQDFEHRRGIK